MENQFWSRFYAKILGFPGPTSFAFTFIKILPCKSLDELDKFLLNVLACEQIYNGLVSRFVNIWVVNSKWSFWKVFYIQSFFGKDVRKNIKFGLGLILEKNVQKLLSWSGLRTTKPSLENWYKPIVKAIDQALKEKFTDYDYSILSTKIQALLQSS